ncbi:MAG: hypothetical protein ACAH17_00090 [Candidatus Paceibacterota bacterium]
MALQKQIVRMSAEGGLDTKTDEKNVLATNFAKLENVVFTKTLSFSKRFGYLAYPDSILESTDRITSGQAATTFKNELLRYSDTTLYSYSEAEEKWSDKGDVKFALASEDSITTNGTVNLNPSHDTYENLTCYVYEHIDVVLRKVEYRIVDSLTGSIIFTGLISSGRSPAVVAIQGKFFIFYYDSGTIYFQTVNFSTPSQISSAVSALSSSTVNFEVEKIGNRAYVVTAGTTGINACYINSAGSVSTPLNVSDATTYNVYSVSAEQTNSVRFVYGKTSAGPLKTVLYSADLNYAIHSVVTLEASTIVSNIGAVVDPNDTNASQIYASIAVSDPYNLKRYVVTSAGVTSSSAALIYQACLQSKPQSYGSKVYFAISKNTSILVAGPPYTLFRTYFLASEDAAILTKFSEDLGVFRTLASLPKLNVEEDKLAFCGAEPSEIQANTGITSVAVPTKVKKYSADFSQANNYFDATLGDNLHISGGVLRMYDGTSVVEHNFLLTPPAPQFVSEVNTFDALIVPGSYQYVLVYAWTDKWGQIHRSTPSLPLTHVVSTNNKEVTIRIQTLPFTEKENVELELYRTEANGTVLYKRAYEIADRTENSKTFEKIDIVDNLPDDELIQNEVLYTEGGVLENVGASSSKYLTTYKGRVFLLLSDGYGLQYSKKREQNGPVEFAAELKIALDEAGGPGTCMAVLDDHLIIFKQSAILALTGEGPNNLGEQDDFRVPYSIASDVGCVDPNSVVLTPEGLMFKSAKGIYILRRGFSVEYLGAPAEGFNDLTITSATLVSNTNEVRFTTNSGTCIVYDYFHKKWTTFTNIDAIDAINYNDSYIFLRSNGDLMRETPNEFSDNGSYIRMRLESSWIQTAGIQGFERFYKMLILGSYKSEHSLRIRFAYDFDPTFVHECIVNAGELLQNPAFGEGGDYGDENPMGGEYPLYQFRIFPKRQKCEAFKFLIEDIRTEGNGEGLSLSNFAAEVGLKPPGYKKADNRSFGAS